MRGAILALPQYALMMWCSVKKCTGTTLSSAFTFIEIIFAFRRVLFYGWSVANVFAIVPIKTAALRSYMITDNNNIFRSFST
jgi:hypothetical protein